MAVGHVTVQTAIDSLYTFDYELAAHAGEMANSRVRRVCLEQDVRCMSMENALSAQMGEQAQSTFMDILRDCETTDGGVLVESPSDVALWYLPSRSLYGNLPAVTLDCATNDLSEQLAPTYDESQIHNDVTTTRYNGSTARYVDNTSVTDLGRYPDSVSANVYHDYDLLDRAAWAVHLGSLNDARFPRITVALHRSQISSDIDTVRAMLGVDIGDRMDVLHPPSWASRETLRLLVMGIAETLSNFEYTIIYTCVPQRPWNVGVFAPSAFDTIPEIPS
jgi:hypothetical protein